MVPRVIEPTREDIEQVWATLDRALTLDAIGALANAAFGGDPVLHSADDTKVAIGFDTNVILRLGDKSRTDVVDYLGSRTDAPMILPGQVIQEFWNNRLTAIETHAKSVREKFQALSDDVKKLGPEFGSFPEQFRSEEQDFATDYSFVLDPSALGRLQAVFKTLETKAILAYVPRAGFLVLADARDRTRTPPGFKDPGQHGDFFVWADYLLGLHLARTHGQTFDLAVFVTQDSKPDWSLRGRAHPVLAAEVRALVDVPFEIWDITMLTKFASTKTSAPLALGAPAIEMSQPTQVDKNGAA
jgi:hypothetical protein